MWAQAGSTATRSRSFARPGGVRWRSRNSATKASAGGMRTLRPRRTGRATLTQRAARTGGRWKLDCPAWLEGHDHSTRTLQFPALPIQMKGALGKIRSLMHWPRFAENGQRITPLLHQRARQVRAVEVPFGQRALLGGQVGFARLRHTGLRHLGWSHSYSNNQPTVQIAQHMAFVAINEQTPALATVAPLT